MKRSAQRLADTWLHRHAIVSSAALAAIAVLAGTTAVQAQDLQSLEAESIKAAVNEVADSVVRIETVGGLEIVGKTLVGTGPTTGLVISEDGHIVSSAFNFAQKPTSILVTVPGHETRLPAKLVARDESRSVVLLKVEPKKPLKTPKVVSRDDLVVGQWTIAMGRTFSADTVSMSAGVLSAKHRIWGKAVQTDCKVSPANYGGPLIDIQGRVIGVLVPMSPRGTGDMAGAEWYDSGIGFAAPLESMIKRLDQWSKGEDLKPGILGIGLKGNDVYAVPAEVASVRIKSPAAEIGIKAGDTIVEINGQPVTRQAQLKHALGPLYGGDKVSVKVKREGKEVDLGETTLVSELVPYVSPYFGVLPVGDADQFVVRHVLAGSPAEEQGVLPGDILLKWNDRDTPNEEAARVAASDSEAGDEITVLLDRGGEKVTVKFKAATLPEDVADVPPVDKPEGDAPAAVGVIDITLPEQKNECFAYVPESYRAETPAALLVWLHAPSKFDQDEMLASWKSLADERGFIFLAPQSLDPKRWTAPEAEFIKGAIEEVSKLYTVDPDRLAIGGEGAGGAMAWLLARQERELIRGLAPIGSPVPRGGAAPESDPQNRLAIYITLTDQPRQASTIRQAVEALRKAKLPVTLEEEYKEFGASQREEIARWLDNLDRL